MSDSVRPHRWQPNRLPRPWDSPGKDTGVGCHCLLQCMKVKSESEVAQSCPTLSDPMQLTRLLHPWDFLVKSTGVECHCLLRVYILGLINSNSFLSHGFTLIENRGPIQAEKDPSPMCNISTPAKVLSLKSTLLCISLFPFPTPRSI